MPLLSLPLHSDATAIPPALHAPDGFLSVQIAAVMWLLTVAVLAVAVRRANATLDDRAIPLLGVMGAFVFAAQMVNFPVAFGTTGHLVGGVLVAVLLGPWSGTLVMTAIVGVQAFVFRDGGLVVLGANIFNMGIVGTLGGYAVYRAIAAALGGEDRARIPAAAIAAWLAVVGGSVAISLQLAASGRTALELTLPAMIGIHALIGLGEAAITAAALGFITGTRPDLLRLRQLSAVDRRPIAGGEGAS
jgi:cobalt/nickel transport system permease protein